MMEDTKELYRYVQGKVIQQDYDWITSLTGECTYCLTDSQVQMILATVDYLGWTTRWYSETGTIDKQVILDLKGGLVEALMNGCCDEGNIYRWTIDGTLEVSIDEGSTWTPAPRNDPRINSPQFPPMAGADGEDKKCIAATGAVALIQEQVSAQLTDGMTRYALDQLIKDWVSTYIETSNIFTALMTVIANQIFALVIATLRPALTSTVYDTLLCILYNNMGSNASVSEAQWEAIRSDITAQIGGIAGIFLEHLMYLLGVVGLTNLIRAGGAVSGDCASCGNTCNPEKYVLYADFIAVGQNIAYGSDYYEVTSYQAANGTSYVITHTEDISDCCQIASYEVLSGNPIVTLGVTNCNNTPDEYAPQYPAIVGLGTCTNHHYWTSSSIFTIRVYLVDCT